ncbi:MAG: Hint domain-containing protein [Sulfitobacter sp.]
MTWLAVTDHEERRFSLRGLGAQKQNRMLLPDTADALLTRGTILFETHPVTDDKPQRLFGLTGRQPWPRSLYFETLPGGGIAMTQKQGSKTTRAEITRSDSVRRDVLRATYAWDAQAKWGRLTLEQPEETTVITVPVSAPMPLALRDIRLLMLGGAGQTFAPEMIFAALSDEVEPVGPMPTLMPQTPIETPWGYKDAADLQRGDTVTTHSSGVVPVVHRISRTVPARGSFQPLRIRAPYFGLQQDIIVSPEQRLLIDGPEVEYLFGQEAVLVPARHLVNGFTAFAEPCGPIVSYTQLLLPKHETLLGAGTTLESLYIGRIRRDTSSLKNSLLANLDRSGLPEHGRPSHQVLRQFEAIHLSRQRAA